MWQCGLPRVLTAEAMPSGPVREDAYEWMADLVCDAVREGCDVALLDLHGAMVASWMWTQQVEHRLHRREGRRRH